MRIKTKKVIGILLCFALVFSLLPTTAFAVNAVVIAADTSAIGELNPGDTFSVPFNVIRNEGFAVANLTVLYDSSKLALNSVVKGTLSGEYTMGEDSCMFLDVNGTNTTETGLLLTASFTVKADAAPGASSISLKLTNDDPDNDFADVDTVGVDATFTPGTVTIAGEISSALTFTDGANTYDYSALHTDNYSLTAPGAGYYFAGWFKGITADGDKLKEENGRLVLKSAEVEDLTSFAAIELRPKYEEAPEAGEYRALWIHENDANPTVMVLEVYPESIIYRKLSYTDAEKQIITTNDVIRSAWTHVAGGGNGRVKLVKDMTTDDLAYKGSAESGYLNYGLWIDLNGCSITDSFETGVSSSYSGGSVLYLRDDVGGAGAVDSSHGQGKLILDTSKKDGYTSRKALDLSGNSQHEVKWVRDVDLVCDCPNAYPMALLFGGTTLELMDNVNITQNCQTGNTFYAIYSSDVASRKTYIERVSNCTVTTNGVIWRQDYPGAYVHLIENCTFTSTAATGNGIELSGDMTFGEGNTITTGAPTLFAGTERGGNLYFNSNGTYKASENAFDGSVKFMTVPAEGYVAHNNSGALEFVQGFTLTYMSHDGTELLWKDSYAVGETPVDNRSLTYPVDHVSSYDFDGWGTGVEGGVIDVTALKADTTLYAQRTKTTLEPVVIRTLEGGEPESFALWKDAIDISSDYKGKSATLQLQKDLTITEGVDAGYFKLTYDLNGHTVTYDGTGAFYKDTYPSEESYLTVTSTADKKGTIRITGNVGLYIMGTDNNTDNPLTINNVRVEAPNLVSTGAGTSASGDPNGIISIYNSGTGGTAINDIFITNSELVAPQAPVIDYYTNSTSKNTKINATLVNSSLEGGNCAVNIHGSDSANPVFTLTADKDCTFKNAAGTDPIKTAAGSLKLNTTYPEEYQYKAIGDGLYGFEPVLSFNDGAASSAASSAPEIETQNETVTISNASSLVNFESVTVKNSAAEVEFSSDALGSIAIAASGSVELTVKESEKKTGELKRISLDLRSGDTVVDFTGRVTVKVPFTPEEGRNYAVFYDDGAALQIVDSKIEAGYIIFSTTHFSDYVIKENAGFDMKLSTDKEHYNAGETITAKITLSREIRADIRGYEFELDYDENQLELKNIELKGDFSEDTSAANGNKIAGVTNGNGVAIDSAGKELAEVTFTVKDDIAELSEISIGLKDAVCSKAYDMDELVSVTAGAEIKLHNLVVTLKADANSKVNDTAVVTLYAKYNESGLYSDKARTASAAVTATPNTGYRLADDNWTDGTTEYKDYAAVAALTFTEGKTFTLKAVQQFTITFATPDNATPVDVDPITVDKGTKLGDVTAIPTYTPNEHYSFSHWKIGNTDYNSIADYAVNSDITVKYVAAPSQFTFTGESAEGITENCVSGVDGGNVSYLTPIKLTYEYTGNDKAITGVAVTVDNTPITVTAQNENGIWTVEIPGESITGAVKVSVSLSSIYTIYFKNGTGVVEIAETAYQVQGSSGYYDSVSSAKAGGAGSFTVPNPAPAEGYRLADKTSENLWKSDDEPARGFNADTVKAASFEKNTTLTAQAIKKWKVSYVAGENGSLSGDSDKLTLIIDDGTPISTLLNPAGITKTPNPGYKFDKWEASAEDNLSGDIAITAKFADESYAVTLPSVTGITVTLTNGAEGGKATHGTDLQFTVKVDKNYKATEINYTIGSGNKITVNNKECTPGTTSYAIEGKDIIGAISITVTASSTADITFKTGDLSKGGIGGVSDEKTAKTFDVDYVLKESDIPQPAAKPGYKFDGWDVNPVGNTVTEAKTFTAKFVDASYKLTQNGAETADGVTHGASYTFTPAVEGKVVKGVSVTIGGTEYAGTVKNADGSYTINGNDIIGDVVIAYDTVDAVWEFITYEAYKGGKEYSKIAILKTEYSGEKTYRLEGYGNEAYYSEKYGGYVWFVYQADNGDNKAETEATLSAKLAAADGAAAKLTYENGDLNNSGEVREADAGIINDVLNRPNHSIADKLRFELDVNGDMTVSVQDVQWILNKVVGKQQGV